MSDVIQYNIQQWRAKAREGTLTPEEMRQAIDAVRKERIKASGTSATAKETREAVAKKKAPVDSDALLDGLMGD